MTASNTLIIFDDECLWELWAPVSSNMLQSGDGLLLQSIAQGNHMKVDTLYKWTPAWVPKFFFPHFTVRRQITIKICDISFQVSQQSASTPGAVSFRLDGSISKPSASPQLHAHRALSQGRTRLIKLEHNVIIFRKCHSPLDRYLEEMSNDPLCVWFYPWNIPWSHACIS